MIIFQWCWTSLRWLWTSMTWFWISLEGGRGVSPENWHGAYKQLNNSLFELHKPEGEIRKQILFFHGFQFEKSPDVHLSTWESRSGSEPQLWPKTWLGNKYGDAHILTVAYNTEAAETQPWRNFNKDIIVENLLANLLDGNIGQLKGCPTIMVGHGFGGLVIKQLCLQAQQICNRKDISDFGRTRLRNMLENLRGVFYYSTPHGDSRFLDAAKHFLDGPLLELVEWLSAPTTGLNLEFDSLSRAYPRLRFAGVGESLPANQGPFTDAVLVPEASSRVGQNFSVVHGADHFSICKPKSDKEMGFKALTRLIKEVCSDNEAIHKCDGLPTHCVGLLTRAVKLQDKLKQKSVLGVVGMGGIGKTTLAKQVFNNISWKYEYTCFVEDVKDWTPKSTLGNHLKHSFYQRGTSVKSVEWYLLEEKKVLIMMDDVDCEEQLSCLPPLHHMGKDSLIVLTTRKKDVLKFFDEYACYEVDFLHPQDAERLFCRHAFRQDNIPLSLGTRLKRHARKVIEKCNGLPLTLEVLGRCVGRYGSDLTLWTAIIDKLCKAETITGNWNDRVCAKLKISYDALEDTEKKMFIDAATFFVNEPLEMAFAAWSTAYGNPEKRWASLVSRCLVKSRKSYVTHGVPNKKIWMHEHLQDLGKKQSSLVLTNESEDTEVTPRHYRLAGQRFDVSEMHVEHLKYLHLDCVWWEGPVEISPRNLHFLRCREPRGPGIPIAINLAEMKNLAVLELEQFERVRAFMFPKALRILKLRRIEGLVWLPKDLGTLSSLRVLELKNLNVAKLPESLGDLSLLMTLDLDDCPNIARLPNSFGNLTSLQHLFIGNCVCLDKLRTLPESFGQLAALKMLYINAPELTSLPDSFGLLTSLQRLKLRSHKMHVLPQNFGRLTALIELELNVEKLQSLPDSFHLLVTLHELRVCSGQLHKLPERFGQLHELRELKLETPKLWNLPDTFMFLKALEDLQMECTDMQTLPDNFGQLSVMRRLKIDCNSLGSLPDSFGELSFLEELDLRTNNLRCLPESMGKLSSLKRWTLTASKLTYLPESIGNLPSPKESTIEKSKWALLSEEVGKLFISPKMDFLSTQSDVVAGRVEVPASLERLTSSTGNLTLGRLFN